MYSTLSSLDFVSLPEDPGEGCGECTGPLLLIVLLLLLIAVMPVVEAVVAILILFVLASASVELMDLLWMTSGVSAPPIVVLLPLLL